MLRRAEAERKMGRVSRYQVPGWAAGLAPVRPLPAAHVRIARNMGLR
jgi:hypothetical protein